MAKLTLLEQHRRVLRAMQRAQIILGDCRGIVNVHAYCNDVRNYYKAIFTVTTFDHTGREVRVKKKYTFEWTPSLERNFKKRWNEFLTATMKELWEDENNG